MLELDLTIFSVNKGATVVKKAVKKKTATKKTATKKKPAPKKRGVNKSQAIRDYLDAHHDAKPKEVVESLAAKKVKVTPQQVSTVKSKMAGGAPKKRRRVAGANGHAKSDQVNLNLLIEAKRFASRAGGVEDAQRLLEALKKLDG